MNKKYLFFVVLFALGNVSAFSLDASLKDNYSSGETLQADILVFGQLEEDILTGDIGLECEGFTVSVVPSLIKVEENHYYSFFDLGDLNVGNCSFVVKDVLYYEGGFLEQNDFKFDFKLVEVNGSVIHVSPAAFRTTDLTIQNSFDVYLTNNGESVDVLISTTASFIDLSESSISLRSEDISSFNIYVSPVLIEETEKEEIVLTYDSKEFIIPVWIFYEENFIPVEDNITLIDGSLIGFVMDVNEINSVLNQSEDTYGYVTIQNIGTDLNEITFSLTGNLEEVIGLQTERVNDFNRGDIVKEYFYVNQRKNAESGNYSGALKVEYDFKSIEFPIFVEILGSEAIIEINGSDRDNGSAIESNAEGLNISIWWYVLIFFVILFIIVYVVYKKKSKKPVNYLQKI